MASYDCLRCGYSTNLKANFKKHLKRKVLCKPSIKDVPIKYMIEFYKLYEYFNKNNTDTNIIANNSTKKYKCKYCNRSFSTAPSRSRHQLHYCKERDNILDNLRMKNLIDMLGAEVKGYMEENQIGTIDIDSIYNNHGQMAGNNINNTMNNNQINNIDNSKKIDIHNYGEEDLSHITDHDYKEMLKDPFSALSKLINAIHFNDLKPENQNLRIPNIKNPFVETFKDGEWVVGNQYKLLCKIYNIKKEILHQAFLRVEDQLDEKTKELYYEFRRVSEQDLFTVQSQITDIKATIISGTRHKPPLPSRHALRQTCCPSSNKNILKDIG
jgi:hypothetical protein